MNVGITTVEQVHRRCVEESLEAALEHRLQANRKPRKLDGAGSRPDDDCLLGADRQRLEEVRAHPQSPQKHVWRARIILTLGAGHGLFETIRRTGVSKLTVWRWWDRFQTEGITGLWRDKTRPPGRAPISPAKVAEVVQTAMEHASHWTLKALAHETGVAMSSVRTILRRHRLYPHRVSTFKVSRDPALARKIRDVVGLYVNPPDHAVVLSIDEKPQIPALGRTQRP